jgi:hypothetical protein
LRNGIFNLGSRPMIIIDCWIVLLTFTFHKLAKQKECDGKEDVEFRTDLDYSKVVARASLSCFLRMRFETETFPITRAGAACMHASKQHSTRPLLRLQTAAGLAWQQLLLQTRMHAARNSHPRCQSPRSDVTRSRKHRRCNWFQRRSTAV